MRFKEQIHRTVFLLGVVSLLNDLAGELIMAVLPIFLIQLSGSGGWVVGLIGGLEDATKSFLSFLFGHLSDRWGRKKPLVFLGYLVPALFRLALPFSTHWPLALLFRVMDRVGKGMRTAPRDALIADAVTASTRGVNYGFHRALDNAGALLGSLLALILFWELGLPLEGIILIGGLVSLASLIPLSFVADTERLPQEKRLFDGLKELPKTYYLSLGALALFALGNFSYMFFLLKVNAAFTEKLAIGLPIAMYVIYNSTATLLATPAGMLSDKLGRRPVLFMGYLLFALVALGFAFADGLWVFVPLFWLYGTVFAIIESNQKALIADLAPPAQRATALGLFHMTIGLAAFVASVIAGVLWGGSDSAHQAPFFYGSVMALLGALALIFARPNSLPRSP